MKVRDRIQNTVLRTGTIKKIKTQITELMKSEESLLSNYVGSYVEFLNQRISN